MTSSRPLVLCAALAWWGCSPGPIVEDGGGAGGGSVSTGGGGAASGGGAGGGALGGGSGGGGDMSDAGEADGGLTLPARIAAASATARTKEACVAVAPFYWEIGDQSGALGTGSITATGSATTYDATTLMPIASASKWLYGAYHVQKVAGALTADDIKFLTFWSGYTDFRSCSQTSTVGSCLTEPNPGGTTNGTFEAATENKFLYSGGHMQKHAALNGLAALDNATLAAEVRAQLGTEIELRYTQPQLAGGALTSAAQYAKFLRKILSGQLLMKAALGTHAVCTDRTTCALALGSPGPAGLAIHYSIGHWVEDDPVKGDGAFSSAGAFGFYPWIDSTKTLYGIIARRALEAGSGFDSLECGGLVRKAWVTGQVQ
jgi:hypothetical protein